MSDTPETSSLMLLGEMRGQMREIVHTLNNLLVKFEALAKTVDSSGHIPAQVADHEKRILALEATENRRVGAMGLGAVVMKALPLIAASGAGAVLLKIFGG